MRMQQHPKHAQIHVSVCLESMADVESGDRQDQDGLLSQQTT